MAEGLLKYLDKSAQGLSRIPRGLLAWAGDAAKRGLLDYNAALTGYDEAGQPVPHTMRALDLLGNTLPGVAPAGGVVLGAGPVARSVAAGSKKYYHVAPDQYESGPLLSLRKQMGDDAQEEFAKRWPGAEDFAPYHQNYIFMYDDVEDAKRHARDFGGKILEVDGGKLEKAGISVKNDMLEIPYGKKSGYPYVEDELPEDFLRFLGD